MSEKNQKTYLLGKSHYALSILFDMLSDKTRELTIVPNISDEANDSRNFPFEHPAIQYDILLPEAFSPQPGDAAYLASIGRSRSTIFQFFRKYTDPVDLEWPALIHPSAVIGHGLQMGRGFHLSPLSVLAPYVKLGDFVVINRNVSIGHHSQLADFVTINPGVKMAGNCRVGQNTVIGIGSTIIDGITIGANSVIGAGSLVTKDIPEGVVAFGSPAKIVRQNG